eukprot:2622061-Pleurochrysis_carterae.AAC.1
MWRTFCTSRTLEGRFAGRSRSLGSTAIGRTGRGRVAYDWKVAQLDLPRCDEGSIFSNGVSRGAVRGVLARVVGAIFRPVELKKVKF